MLTRRQFFAGILVAEFAARILSVIDTPPASVRPLTKEEERQDARFRREQGWGEWPEGHRPVAVNYAGCDREWVCFVSHGEYAKVIS